MANVQAEQTEQDRFWSNVYLDTTEHGCWWWTAGQNGYGYGAFHADRMVGAHRYAWKLEHGTEPKLCVLHRCDNRACVRIDHLFLGTRAENSADMVTKDRHPRGERNAHAKLTDAQVIAIRRAVADGARHRDVADRFGVSRPTITTVVNRKTWRHL